MVLHGRSLHCTAAFLNAEDVSRLPSLNVETRTEVRAAQLQIDLSLGRKRQNVQKILHLARSPYFQIQGVRLLSTTCIDDLYEVIDLCHSSLTTLIFADSADLRDVSFLSKCANLTHLGLSNSSSLVDVSALAQRKSLQVLDLSACTEVDLG